MLINGLLVFLGGGIGSLLRYIVNLLTQIYSFNQIGTLFVNILGSFLFGFLIVFTKDKGEYFNIFFLAGVLGGFTTFSQFSYDVINLQNETIRVTGKKRDDLQEAISIIKDSNIETPLNFGNFRD